MRVLILAACILTAGLGAARAWADIYIWEDADGVRHISNLNPPPGAEIFVRTPAPPPEASAEAARGEVEAPSVQAQIRAGEDRLREQEKEADLERRLAAVEARIEEAKEELERARQGLSAAKARDRDEEESGWRYAGTVVYTPAPYSRAHPKRFRRPAWGAGRLRQGLPYLVSPFRLGAVHIPLINAHDRFRRAKPHRTGDDAVRRHGPAKGPSGRKGRRR